MITNAISFLNKKVFDPALNNSNIDRSVKAKISNTHDRIQHFKKVGDLNLYLSRFDHIPEPGEDLVYKEMKRLGLITYEDILPVFQQEFKYYLPDITTLDDFVIGENYTSWDISIFAKTYNNLSGIYLIGDEPNYQAIFIKATIEDPAAKYQNKWIVECEELKYYLKSISGKFSVNYKDNRAILNSKGIPIYVYTKVGTVCTLRGIFKFQELFTESDGSMWSRLIRTDEFSSDAPVSESEYWAEFDKDVRKSQTESSESRQKRLFTANKIPRKIKIISAGFVRNPDVVAEALARANGFCEACDKEAPFKRASDGSPYLEVHHIVPLSKGGEDSVQNVAALCPNCHREVHFGTKNLNG